MGTTTTILVIIGLLACGLGISWLYVDIYNTLVNLRNKEKAEAEQCPSMDDESEE